MPRHYLLQVFLFFFITISISACKTDRDKDGISDDADKCPDTYALTKDGCLIPVTELKGVHLFMDISLSMGGYFKDQTEFKNIVSDLAVKIDKRVAPEDIYFVGDSTIKFKGNILDFSSQIATTVIATQRSSELHNIFKEIASKTDLNHASVFISDCIMSFPDAAIRANREINKTDAASTLKNYVFSTFTELRKNGQAVSVYAFESKFNGTYYNYQNRPIELKSVNRPFYVWIIAKKDVLKAVDDSLDYISSFKPVQSLHFGLFSSPVSNHKLLTQIETSGTWTKGENDSQISEVDIKDKGKIKFSYALNLDSLPNYAKDPGYLKRLNVVAKGCIANASIIPKNTVSRSKIPEGGADPANFQNATHLLIVTVTSMTLDDAQIDITLPLEYDTWYTRWSCPDDKSLDSISDKTFAFQNLIDGVRDAFESRNKNYINFSIHLNK